MFTYLNTCLVSYLLILAWSLSVMYVHVWQVIGTCNLYASALHAPKKCKKRLLSLLLKACSSYTYIAINQDCYTINTLTVMGSDNMGDFWRVFKPGSPAAWQHVFGFLKLFLCGHLYVCVCLHVCVSTLRLLITSGLMWRDMDPIWLITRSTTVIWQL